MPIDPNIALSYKPVGLDIAGAMQAAEERKLLQSRNALAGAQQAAAQDELNNALAARRYAGSVDLNDPKNAMRLMQYGETGAKMLQALQAGRASAASARSTQGEYASKKADYYLNGVLPFARNKGKQGIISMLDMMRADPDLAGSPLASMPKEFADANLPDPVTQPNEYAQWEQRMGLGLSEFLKQNAPKFTQVDAGGYGYTQQTPGLGGPATVVPGSRYTKTATPGELLTNARAKVDPMQYPLLAAAVAEGRMSPDRVNSRNASFLEQALQRNPKADLNSMAARGALMRNAGFQQKAISAEIIPEVLQNVVKAGKELNFSDVKFIANLQKWTAGQLQDPKLTEYMTLRNDSLLSIAATMRLIGMSDYATKLEEEAASPTMSPKQLDAWMSGQMKALSPRLKKLAGLSIDGANPAAASSTPTAVAPTDGVDHSNPLLGGKP